MSLLTAIALCIFVAEAQIPPVVPIPGVKLGLANIVTVYAVFTLGPLPALMILLVRVLLSSVFMGQLLWLIYSLAGGLCCWLIMLVLHRVLTLRQIWVCSAAGALCHNAGQLIAAIFVTKTPALAAYFPILAVSGIITGVFTGLCAQFLVNRLNKTE